MEVLLIAIKTPEEVKELIKSHFQAKSVSITTVPCCEIAFEKLKSERPKPKLILVDLSLPDLNLYEFLRTLKSDENLCKIPFCFVKPTHSKEHDNLKKEYCLNEDIVNFYKF